ncbi:MAG: XRE family transcriptional regulator [Bacteroidetes bacterium]|nr:XRE family transcriptional regulator [Bacteroidota bacterium]MDA1121631.1 XRE family transcriptional regulator [Bacteroidota bacterium]
MVAVNENIRFLRKKMNLTQQQFAELIGIKRSLVGAYEEGRAEPRLINLSKMAKVFETSVDILMHNDVRRLSDKELRVGSSKGVAPKIKVLSITVDDNEREYIDLVPQKAAAGYLNGYADPEYVGDLPKFRLPQFNGGGTYRAFEVSGDSMLPIEAGTIIIGKYVEKIADIKNGKPYILMTEKDGIVYKRVFNYVDENGKLFLVSDNKSYTPYEIEADDVIEIWESKAFISTKFPDENSENRITLERLATIVLDLQKEIIQLKER